MGTEASSRLSAAAWRSSGCVRFALRSMIGAALASIVAVASPASAGDPPLAPAARMAVYPWVPDNGNGTYANPVIHADYSDPDVVRVGDEYFMVSSSFVHTPGLPVLRSTDLVNWRIIGHVVENLPSPMFDRPLRGKGIWAPSIRFHRGEFYVYFGDPDRGIFMTKAKRAAGPWQPLTCVKEAKGWIDPCPLWDDDGSAYLVHAWAKSRAGFNSMLSVNRMNAEGTTIVDEGATVFDGHAHQPTIEGPKFYKRNGWYYIFAPAGGVKPGWQAVLRSKNIFGPYEDTIVMDQGTTAVNGPHQGAWIDTPGGRDWFIHFQDRNAYGRIIHLEPMAWTNGWPVIGLDRTGSGKGEPVAACAIPDVKKPASRVIPQTTDTFDSPALGLQWQWEANHQQDWYSLRSRKGMLRLFAVPMQESDTASLWDVPNLLMQKFPAREFTVTTRLDCRGLHEGDRSGLVVFGLDYCSLEVSRDGDGFVIGQRSCMNADRGGREHADASMRMARSVIELRVHVDSTAQCVFSCSEDGKIFIPFGHPFTAREGMWVGAKVGLFSVGTDRRVPRGYADYQYFKFQ